MHRKLQFRVWSMIWLAITLTSLCLIFGEPLRAQGVVSKEGVDLIARFEVGGKATYDRRYQWPICPACMSTASGVTIGIGYDLRHNTREQILADWARHPQRSRLPPASGVGKAQAVALARSMRDVVTPWPLALEVLQRSTLPRYDAIARRSFGPGYDRASQPVRDALVSVVYNRGGSTVGPARAEFRAIRDRCLPAGIPSCTAGEIRAMTRLWVGTPIEAGMTRRRYAEAAHAER